MKKILFYLPRIFSIMLVAFFALFILEGFDPNFGWQSGLMHFFLAFVILAVTILAWKKPKLGGWLFIILGLYFWNSLPIATTHIVTGILFIYTTKNK
jgi:hypothetical protein